MSAAVVHHRALAWSQGFGYADLEQGVWAEPDTRYRLASVSKPFAAVLVMQLVEQGKLSLDAPMKDFRIHRWFQPDPARYREQPILQACHPRFFATERYLVYARPIEVTARSTKATGS